MNPRKKAGLAAIALLASTLVAAAPQAIVAPPARNWTLPLFTKEGFRQMTLRDFTTLEASDILSSRVFSKG